MARAGLLQSDEEEIINVTSLLKESLMKKSRKQQKQRRAFGTPIPVSELVDIIASDILACELTSHPSNAAAIILTKEKLIGLVRLIGTACYEIGAGGDYWCKQHHKPEDTRVTLSRKN